MNRIKKTKGNSGRVDISLIEILVIAAIIGTLCLLLYACYDRVNNQMPRAYSAWCKQTGNPKCLTYEEWKDLVEVTEERNGQTFIFIPH